MVEGNGVPEDELRIAFDIVGPVLEKFVTTTDLYEADNSRNDGLYISSSMDPTSHFESATTDVLRLYK